MRINSKLLRILKSAGTGSTYYSDLFKKCAFDYFSPTEEAYKSVPLLSRELIFLNSEKILHRNYQSIDRKDLIVERTSGSTGCFVEVLWARNEFFASNISLWRRRYKWYGITPSDRKCTFFTDNIDDRVVLQKNVLAFSGVYTESKDIENYLKNLQRYRPRWLMISPSIALLLLSFCKENSLRLPDSIKYIELFGESVSTAAYNSVVDYFGIPTAIMYGAKEVNGIALMCPCGNMHLLSDNNYIEVVESGKILITNLHNTCFPIIRYDIGDVVELKDVACSCGESGLIVNKVFGKNYYLTHLNKQSGITTSVLKSIIDNVDSIFDYPIIQFQIQYKKNGILIHLHCKSEYNKWKNEISAELKKRMQTHMRCQVDSHIVFHESPLPYDAHTGKLPMVVVD